MDPIIDGIKIFNEIAKQLNNDVVTDLKESPLRKVSRLCPAAPSLPTQLRQVSRLCAILKKMNKFG